MVGIVCALPVEPGHAQFIPTCVAVLGAIICCVGGVLDVISGIADAIKAARS